MRVVSAEMLASVVMDASAPRRRSAVEVASVKEGIPLLRLVRNQLSCFHCFFYYLINSLLSKYQHISNKHLH